MDAGEYDTNTFVINSISSVAFRIYEPVVTHTSNYTFAASDVENALRSDGHLVYMDSVRRGIWCFRLLGKEGVSMGLPTLPNLEPLVDVCGYKLGLVDEGAFEPISLLRSKPLGANPMNTPNSSSSSGSTLDTSARSSHPYSLPSAHLSAHGGVELETRLPMQPTQAIPDTGKGYKSIPAKDVYDYFISSVLSGLATCFCYQTGAIPLNSKSFLFPRYGSPEQDGGGASSHTTLATLRIYLTTTGSLIISLCHSVVYGLAWMGQAVGHGLLTPGTPVLAAPFGTFATFHSVVDGDYLAADGGMGMSPDTQISKIRQYRPDDKLQQWRVACAKILENRGVRSSQIQKAAWFNIQYLRQAPADQKVDGKRTPIQVAPTAILWPSTLCFWKSKRLNSAHESAPLLEGTCTFDPLTPVKSWLVDSEDRAEVLARRTREREADRTREAADPNIRMQQGNGYSPVALRASNNPVPGAMYPTPPDAVQNQVGVTPTFDGTVSSPGNPAATVAVVDLDAAMSAGGAAGDAFADTWDGGEVKRERPSETHIGEVENMFGELDADIFGDGDNDVTDADFNFFDEEAAGPNDIGFDAGLDDLEQSPATPHGFSRTEPEQLKKEADDIEMTAPPVVGPPEFTKPELKHARSSLVDDSGQKSSDPPGRHAATGIKRQPSPFSAETVFKRVKASLDGPNPRAMSSSRRAPARRGSVFEKVDFSPFLSFNNRKYQENGRFEYHWPPHYEKGPPTSTRTQGVESGRMQGKGANDLKDLQSRMGALIASITGGIENSSLLGEPTRCEVDSDEASLISDQDDDSSDGGAEPFSPIKSAVIRRRPEDDSISVAQSLKEFDSTAVASPQIGAEFCKLPTSDVGEALAAKYFAEPEAPLVHSSLSDDDLITVAQILTEQAVSGFLKVTPTASPSQYQGVQLERRDLSNRVRQSMEALETALPASLGDAIMAQFRPLIEVQDVPLLGQPSRTLSARALGATEQLRPNLFQIPAPHLEVQRNEVNLSVVPSAVTFWEVLGLGPARGAKDVQSVCVFPSFDGLVDSANTFLERMRIVYESLRLGSHNCLATTPAVSDGLVSYEVEDCAQSPSIMSLATTPRPIPGQAAPMSKLAKALASQTVSEKNFVVYFVYLPSSPSSIVDCCSAFSRLFELYKKVLPAKTAPTNDLVLQLVPIDFLASSTSLVLPVAPEYVRLCLEAYDRCTLFDGVMPAPAIILEQPLPRLLDFKLTTSPSANLLHENSCIHIAYATSTDGRWVTAAWTDNRGTKQMTASYCLGRKSKPPTTAISDIACEIWDTTHDLISMWRVHWRVIITKCGPMDQEETDIWVELGKAETKASISLTLLTVDTNPSLQLVPPAAKVPPTASSIFYTTPVSTPQPAVLSPEQSGNPPTTPMGGSASANPPTPGGAGAGDSNVALEPDGDTSLVDVTETTWGAVVSHRLNNSSSLADLNSALASGYLVKRGGTRAEDPPAVLEVNVIHNEGNPRVYETLIREMLMYFRQLGTLARARGVVDRETDVRPWHVAAAEKGVKALYQLM